MVSSNGSVKLDIDVPLPDPVMMHDMAITEDYAIFLDFPMLFDPKVGTVSEALPSTSALFGYRMRLLCKSCEPNMRLTSSVLNLLDVLNIIH